MTISDIEYGCALFLSGATGFSLTWLFFANARRKAENGSLTELLEKQEKEHKKALNDCRISADGARQALIQKTSTVSPVPAWDPEARVSAIERSVAARDRYIQGELQSINAQILEALPEHDSKLRGHAVALDQLEAESKRLAQFANAEGLQLNSFRAVLVDYTVRLEAIDRWIQSKAPQPPTRNAKGRFTKRKSNV